MKDKLKSVILVPYVASLESNETPTAEAKYLYYEHFKDASFRQILGNGLEGRLYSNGEVGLYIIGEGKTNASMYTMALLNNNEFDFTDTKFILFGCCGCARDIGVVGDIYFVGETVDLELGHHADSREKGSSSNHSWYPNQSFERFGYVNLENELFNMAFNLVKDEKAETTQVAKDFMAKSFNNEAWAVRNPKIMKAASATSDSYWKGNYDHNNAQYVVNYYNCKYPFAASDMEDIAVAQVFENCNKLDNLIIMRFAVNTDVFMAGQTPETLWGEGNGSFNSSAFDSFDDAFTVVSKRATDLVWKILSNL